MRRRRRRVRGGNRVVRSLDLTSHPPYVRQILQELETKDHQSCCCKLDFTSLPGMSSDSNALQGGVDVDYSCREGLCGSCETRVIAGVPDHCNTYFFSINYWRLL